MNPIDSAKKTVPLLVVSLVCSGLLPNARAVSPAPDGGYPGPIRSREQGALFGLTTGSYNTAVGFASLRSDITGSLTQVLALERFLPTPETKTPRLGSARF